MTDLIEIFSGKPNTLHEMPPAMPPPVLKPHRKVKTYLPDDGLVRAVNVALAMGQPLLVTGEPGSGKTQLAYAIAQEFGLEVEKTSVRSTTIVNDLFYEFDHLGRFRDSQQKQQRSLQSYLSFTGLGLAILKAAGPDAPLELRPGNLFERERTSPSGSKVEKAAQRLHAPETLRDLFLGDFPVKSPTSSVVLIDELDKAPRDTPNDMLGWLETHTFEIKEIGVKVGLPTSKDGELPPTRPIIVITSNSEKSLPEPFLRRCVFYDIPFPDEDKLRRIVETQLGETVAGGPLASYTLTILAALRDETSGVRRPPGTAEYIGWLTLLVDRLKIDPNTGLQHNPEILAHTLPALIKTREDLEAARSALSQWLPGGAEGE